MAYTTIVRAAGFIEVQRVTFTDTPEPELIHYSAIHRIEHELLHKNVDPISPRLWFIMGGFEKVKREDYHTPCNHLHIVGGDKITVMGTAENILKAIKLAKLSV